MVVIQDDLTDLDEDVGFLFNEQVIQDERLLNLEETSLDILGELDLIEDDLESECLKRILPSFSVIAVCQANRPLDTSFRQKCLRLSCHLRHICLL